MDKKQRDTLSFQWSFAVRVPDTRPGVQDPALTELYPLPSRNPQSKKSQHNTHRTRTTFAVCKAITHTFSVDLIQTSIWNNFSKPQNFFF